MFSFEALMEQDPYSLNSLEKRELFTQSMQELLEWHRTRCPAYQKITDLLLGESREPLSLEQIPFLPVRIFKEFELRSVPEEQVSKVMTSSGTSGQQPSKIFLDRETSTRQTKVLAKIMSNFLGKNRLPMLIVDSSEVVKNRNHFSARGAGILGFSMLGKDVTYALDEKMQLDMKAIEQFQEKYRNESVMIFGFTSIIWEYFFKMLYLEKKKMNLENGILIHGGGWKKLVDQEVSSTAFKEAIKRVSGVSRVHNYYGMVEQTGSIFMECESGFLHASNFSDVYMRDTQFDLCRNRDQGMIQLMSLLPLSYPGHSLISEDLGELVGEDSCACGRLGKYFLIHGRIQHAELRGCSDTQGR